jgi:outer membrane protein assembly factor BamE (lipoprotein component of BamABCDE complex)
MRKISLITTSLLLGTVLFTGCAVKTGNDRIENVTQDNILSMIEDGKSTKVDVRKAFGEPKNIDFMEMAQQKT